MSRTLVGISLLFIAAFVYASKLLSTAILVANNDIVNSENWAVMLDRTPGSIDMVIWISFILGLLLIVFEEFFKMKN